MSVSKFAAPAALVCSLLGACGTAERTTCNVGERFEPAPIGAVRVVVDGDASELAPLRTDVPAYLSRLWSVSPQPL